MELATKPDFAKVLARFEAWWHCEIIDRPLASISVKSDRQVKLPPQRQHATLRDRWFDMEQGLENLAAVMKDGETCFTDDSYPAYFPNLGPELVATVWGCELDFSEYTSWSKPNCQNIREVMKIKPNLDTPYWKAIRKAMDLSLEMGKGKWITLLPDLHTNADLLAGLRDPQNLAMDFIDDPEGVRLACEYVTNFFASTFDDYYNRLARLGQPAATWLPALHQGRVYASSCDFICMISPAMFQEAVLPSIARENEYLDRSIFHLDGPGALKHLDALLERGNLNGIQWVYGAGKGPGRNWIGVFQKIQAAGKCLQILCDDINDAKAIASVIKPQGAWFCPGGSYTPEEAAEFLSWLEHWAAGKRA